MAKWLIKILTREQAVAQGFIYAGYTTDESAMTEIERDYKAQGFSEIVWTARGDKFHYWTKHPAINP